MKALSLTQPWATLIAIGAKRVETRSWSTSYRGRLAIHASKGFPQDCRHLCATQPFLRELTRAGISMPELPLGAIVAVATLKTCFSTDRLVECREGWWGEKGWPFTDDDVDEWAFGDYSEGRFAWLFTDVIRLKSPIPIKGALGLWLLPSDVEAQLGVPAVNRRLGQPRSR